MFVLNVDTKAVEDIKKERAMCLTFRDDLYAKAVALSESVAEKERTSRKTKYDEELKEMIKEVDTNDDGAVTFAEIDASSKVWPCYTSGDVVAQTVTPYPCEIYNWGECLYA